MIKPIKGYVPRSHKHAQKEYSGLINNYLFLLFIVVKGNIDIKYLLPAL